MDDYVTCGRCAATCDNTTEALNEAGFVWVHTPGEDPNDPDSGEWLCRNDAPPEDDPEPRRRAEWT